MNSSMQVPLGGLVAGICAAMLGVPIYGGIILITAGCCLYLLLLLLSKDPATGFKLSKLHYLWIFLVFMGIGSIDLDLNRPLDDDELMQDLRVASGFVRELKSTTTGDVAIVELLNGIDSEGKSRKLSNCHVQLRSEATKFNVDDRILIPAKFERLRDSENHFPSGYAESMAKKGILYSARCKAHEIKVTGHSDTFGGVAVNIGDNLESFIEKTPLARNTRNFLITILLGDRRYLAPEKRDSYSAAGLSHILALSGMHTAIIAGIIIWLLFPINFAGLFKYRLLISCIFLLGYAFITGWAPSTVRATLMAIAVMAAVFLERKNTGWHSLLLASFLILLISPGALTDLGFQLSFISVCALIFFTNPLNPVSQHDHPHLYKVCAFLLCTLSAVGVTWCLSAYYFAAVPVMFLPANIVIVSLLPFYLVCSIGFLAGNSLGLTTIPVISTLFEWLGKTLDITLESADRFINYLTNDGEAVMRFRPSVATVILWLAVVILSGFIINGKKWKFLKGTLVAASLLFLISIPLSLERSQNCEYIIRNTPRSPEIAYRVNRSAPENMVTFHRKAMSGFNAGEERIINLDCPVNGIPAQECEILLLSGGIRNSLPEIMSHIRARQVVIHPSVRKSRENRLIAEADSLGIPCHSIRRDGVYTNQKAK